MHVVLWDTRKRDISKDFAGGYGVGMYQGHGGARGWFLRQMYKRDRRPVSLNFAYLAAIFRRLGHTVQYAEDQLPAGADLYVFNPALVTLDLEVAAMQQALAQTPRPRVLVTGLVAYTLPEAFANLDVKLVKGEPEQLLWKLDEVLESPQRIVEVGTVKNLDDLPWPDWSPFQPQRFKIAYDFWQFPTGLVQQSRGCTFSCNYCPYIIMENATRFRDPEQVVAEIRHGMREYAFRSFKFRDPLFGLDRKRVLALAEHLGKLPKRVQFSIEGRIDILRPETLKVLKEVGLVSITVGIETPAETTLKQYKRAPIKDDKQREFVARCRELGIRTVAGFMIGFPEDTPQSIRNVLKYAKSVNPTFANFNIVTPYPGTEFFQQVREQVASFDYSKYSVYTPVMKYQHLTAEEVQQWHAKCFTSYYFRWPYLQDNALLLWPWLKHLGLQAPPKAEPAAAPATDPLPVLDQRSELRADQPHEQVHTISSPGSRTPGSRTAA
ncbi:MAG: B12-binding domain-containing radical SAM protein [Pirellulales bacterium]|nr:B12-binding domain-containing radical SAM protein [Pirellulales bacterium]